MKNRKVVLSKKRNVTLTLYLLDNFKEFQYNEKRPLIIVCPGGGYAFLSDREAEVVAMQYYAAGIHAAVLRYGINEYAVMPGPIKDAADAVAYVRQLPDKFCIDRENIYISGFSAGGHVAAGLGVFWNDVKMFPEYKKDLRLIRPDGLVLGYPVIDLKASTKKMDIDIKPEAKLDEIEFGQIHPKMPREKIFPVDKKAGRRFVDFEIAMNAYIFGGEYTAAQEKKYSLQNSVSKDTPPAFIWHCAGDALIFPKNSLEFAEALNRKGVDCELHLFSGGEHGIALADYRTANDYLQFYDHASGWMQMSVAWLLKKSGFKEKVMKSLPNGRQ